VRTALDPAILEALARYDSATVQNAAIVVRGYVPAQAAYSGPAIRCMTPESGTLVGYAVTCELSPLTEQPETADWDDYYDSMARANAPTIAVMKDVDDPPCRGAIIGDVMAHRHRALGCVGAVVDGNARDVPGIRRAGLGLWARGRVPGHGPFNIVRHGAPVTVADLHISPGDLLVCDDDGVTRVPLDIAGDVAKACAEVQEREAGIMQRFSTPA